MSTLACNWSQPDICSPTTTHTRMYTHTHTDSWTQRCTRGLGKRLRWRQPGAEAPGLSPCLHFLASASQAGLAQGSDPLLSHWLQPQSEEGCSPLTLRLEGSTSYLKAQLCFALFEGKGSLGSAQGSLLAPLCISDGAGIRPPEMVRGPCAGQVPYPLGCLSCPTNIPVSKSVLFLRKQAYITVTSRNPQRQAKVIFPLFQYVNVHVKEVISRQAGGVYKVHLNVDPFILVTCYHSV